MTKDSADTNVEQTGDITFAMQQKDYPTVIELVRDAVTADPVAALNDPVIREWMGVRYRNIFITEACANPAAVKNSQAPFPLNLVDPRSEREKVGKRMITNLPEHEVQLDLPPVGMMWLRARPPTRATAVLMEDLRAVA